jgi:hypothetical protein
MVHERTHARRAAGVALAWLGCAGLAVSGVRALAWDEDPGPAAGGCAVSRIGVGYDVGYVAALGGYGVTGAALSDVPAGCAGREVAVTLHGPGGEPFGEARAPVTPPTTTVELGAGAVPVAELSGVSLALVADGRRPG